MDEPWMCDDPSMGDPWMNEPYASPMDDPWMGDPYTDPTMDDPWMGDPYTDPTMDDPWMGDPYTDPTMDDPWMGDPYTDPTMDDPWLDDPTFDPVGASPGLGADPSIDDPWMGDPDLMDPGAFDFDFDFEFAEPGGTRDRPGAGVGPVATTPSGAPSATTRSFGNPELELADFDLDASAAALTRGGDELDPSTLIDLALTTTAHELAHLAELDAFEGDLGAEAQAIVDQVGLAATPRLVAVPALVEVDEFGTRVLATMEAAGIDASPAVKRTLAPLSDGQLTAIQRGGAAPDLDASRYTRAYDVLADTWLDLQPEPEAPEPEVDAPDDLAFADDADAPADEVAQAEEPTADAADGTEAAGGIVGGLAVGGAVAAVLALISAVAVWRRKRTDADAGETVADLVEVSRLLNGARTEAEVGAIVVTEAARITSGEAALFSGRSSAVLTEIAASPAFPTDPVLTAPDLARVLDLATPGTFAVGDLDVVAVPVTESGMVGGVLLATGPLTSEQRREQNLRRLASIAGASLATARRQRELEDLSSIDALTGLVNRRRLDEDLAAALGSPDSAPVSFVMVDVDHFKTYNDTHGHAAGDVALATVARVMAAAVGDAGTAYRYGGEEFCVLCPTTDLDAAVEVAEAIRSALETEPFAGEDGQPGGQVTASLGVATAGGGTAGELIEAADGALYRAKDGGRNAVAIAESAAS